MSTLLPQLLMMRSEIVNTDAISVDHIPFIEWFLQKFETISFQATRIQLWLYYGTGGSWWAKDLCQVAK